MYRDINRSRLRTPHGELYLVPAGDGRLVVQPYQSMRVNSIRFTHELGTFEYNATTKKAQAQKGKHDDAIIAMCLALYIRDSMTTDIPLGADIDGNKSNVKINHEIYEEIKRELLDGKPEDILSINKDLFDDDDILNSDALQFRRKNNNLLKEFGW